MGFINDAKKGADITRPRASISWLVGAVVAVVLLLIAFGIGSYLYVRGKTAVGGAGNVAGKTVGSMVTGAFGDGT